MDKTTENSPLPKNPSLEVRLNSEADATAFVRNVQTVYNDMLAAGLGSVHLIIEETRRVEIGRIVGDGIFAKKIKVYRGYTRTHGNNVLFTLPHSPERQTILVKKEQPEPKVEIPVSRPSTAVNVQPSNGAAKRRGRPPKRKEPIVNPDPSSPAVL